MLLVVVVLGALALPATAGSVPERPAGSVPERPGGSVPERHGGPKPSTTTTTTTWPPLPTFDAALAWSDCGDGFQCGTLAVPTDWTGSVPEREAGRSPGDVVPIALLRHPAESPADRIGSLVVNYGGPGESGVDYLRGDVVAAAGGGARPFRRGELRSTR